MQYALSGVRACVCALILDSVIKLGKKSVVDIWTILIAVVVLTCSLLADIPVAVLVVGAGAVGILVKSALVKKSAKEE